MNSEMKEKLINIAEEARENAYAPYSKFKVGAAVIAEDGKYYTGVNIENVSYGLTVCAERNAIFSAIAAGNRKIKAIAVIADTDEPVTPCGACRQVIAEFCEEDTQIIMANLKKEYKSALIGDILPLSFRF